MLKSVIQTFFDKISESERKCTPSPNDHDKTDQLVCNYHVSMCTISLSAVLLKTTFSSFSNQF